MIKTNKFSTFFTIATIVSLPFFANADQIKNNLALENSFIDQLKLQQSLTDCIMEVSDKYEQANIDNDILNKEVSLCVESKKQQNKQSS